MHNKLLKPTVIFVLLTAMFRCSTVSDCDLEKSSDLLRVKFFDRETKLETKFRFSLVTAQDTDSIFYVADSLSVYELNLNPTKKSVAYSFFDGFVREKLEVVYESKAVIISERCGATIQYELDSVHYTDFDSVVVFSQVIDPSIPHNIEIYR